MAPLRKQYLPLLSIVGSHGGVFRLRRPAAASVRDVHTVEVVRHKPKPHNVRVATSEKTAGIVESTTTFSRNVGPTLKNAPCVHPTDLVLRAFVAWCSRDFGAEFLCALSANRHQIEFLEFTISDYATKNIIFMVSIGGHPRKTADDGVLENSWIFRSTYVDRGGQHAILISISRRWFLSRHRQDHHGID